MKPGGHGKDGVCTGDRRPQTAAPNVFAANVLGTVRSRTSCERHRSWLAASGVHDAYRYGRSVSKCRRASYRMWLEYFTARGSMI